MYQSARLEQLHWLNRKIFGKKKLLGGGPPWTPKHMNKTVFMKSCAMKFLKLQTHDPKCHKFNLTHSVSKIFEIGLVVQAQHHFLKIYMMRKFKIRTSKKCSFLTKEIDKFLQIKICNHSNCSSSYCWHILTFFFNQRIAAVTA